MFDYYMNTVKTTNKISNGIIYIYIYILFMFAHSTIIIKHKMGKIALFPGILRNQTAKKKSPCQAHY